MLESTLHFCITDIERESTVTTHPLRLHCWALAAGAVLLAIGAAADSAQGPGRKGQNRNPFAPVIGELRQTRMLLAGANRDYAGLRVRAMKQITQAIHILQGQPQNGQGNGQGGQNGQPGQKAPPQKGKEPQGMSDAQLQQAIQQLQVVLNQLASTQGRPRAVAAMPHVQNAINDLQKALKVN